MVSADEHFEQAMDVTRALAHTQPSDDDDHQLIDYSDADVIDYSGTEKAYVRLFVFSLFLFSFFLRRASQIRAQRVNSSSFLVRLSLTRFYSFLFRSLARKYIEEKCPDSLTVLNKERKAITVTLSVLCTLFRVNGSKNRSDDMAKKLNVTRKVFSELVEKLWGEKSMPNLSLIKNIKDGSVGFSDETLNKYGWADAKKSGVGLLAFFATRSPEQRKVLEAENKKKRRSLNEKTGETELVVRSTADSRKRVKWEDPNTGVTHTVTRTTASKRQLVEWEDPNTGVTYMVPRSTASRRQLVPFNGELMRRSAKCSIINSEKEGKWCPWGDKCPSCDIQTSKLWITLRKAKEHFVRTGDECGYELADKDAWITGVNLHRSSLKRCFKRTARTNERCAELASRSP